MTNPPKLYLLDVSSYIYRAFFVIGRLTNSLGMPTLTVFGFVQMIRKIIEQEYLIVTSPGEFVKWNRRGVRSSLLTMKKGRY